MKLENSGRRVTKILVLVSLGLSIYSLKFIPTSSAQTLVGTVPVGSYPQDVVYDSAKGEIFVCSWPSGPNAPGTVLVISDASNQVIANVTVGADPSSLAYDSTKGEIFVSEILNNTDVIAVMSDATNSIVATINVGTTLFGPFAYDSAKGELYVNQAEGNVSVVSDSTNRIVAGIVTARGGDGIAYDSAKGEIFVANVLTNSVSVISDSTNSVIATINGISDAGALGAIAYDSAKGEVFVGSLTGVSVISDANNQVVANVTITPPPGFQGVYPNSMAYDSAKGEIFVTSTEDTIAIVSDTTNKAVEYMSVLGGTGGVAYDPAKGEVFVANGGSNTVSVISDGSSTGAATSSSVPEFNDQALLVTLTVTVSLAAALVRLRKTLLR